MNFSEGPEEIARLEEISELGLLSEEVAPYFQKAADDAAKDLDLPIALITLVLDDTQYFAAMSGPVGWIKEARGMPLEWSFCANTVRTRKVFIVEDATHHPLMKNSPVVTMDGARCYAGIPLITSKGHAIGSFCVLGGAKREFSEVEIGRLQEFARRIMLEIEKRRSPERHSI